MAVDGGGVENHALRPTGRACCPEILPVGFAVQRHQQGAQEEEISGSSRHEFRVALHPVPESSPTTADAERATRLPPAPVSPSRRRHAGARPRRNGSSPRPEVKEIEPSTLNGLVTQGERYNKVVDIWGRAGQGRDRSPRR